MMSFRYFPVLTACLHDRLLRVCCEQSRHFLRVAQQKALQVIPALAFFASSPVARSFEGERSPGSPDRMPRPSTRQPQRHPSGKPHNEPLIEAVDLANLTRFASNMRSECGTAC